LTLPVETLKSVPREKAVWNANGGFVSVLLTHLLLFLYHTHTTASPHCIALSRSTAYLAVMHYFLIFIYFIFIFLAVWLVPMHDNAQFEPCALQE